MYHSFTPILFLVLVITLSSCVTPDPIHQQNVRAITDTPYPDSTVAGMWMIVGGNSQVFDGRIIKVENRMYLLLEEGGAGLVQKYRKFEGIETPLLIERRITWKSIGPNHWQFVTQPHTAKVLSCPAGTTPTVDASESRERFRYHNGRLYSSDIPNTWVRASETEVKQKLTEIRSLLR